jgi:hypothetical protein
MRARSTKGKRCGVLDDPAVRSPDSSARVSSITTQPTRRTIKVKDRYRQAHRLIN